MGKYKKIDSDLKVSTFQEMDYSEVEKEIKDAMKEGQEKIEQLKDENEKLRIQNDEFNRNYGAVAEAHLKIEAENAELRKEVKKLTPNVPKVHPKKMSFIKDLRLRDTPKLNKTCASCSRRLPINKMGGGEANFCDDCLGK